MIVTWGRTVRRNFGVLVAVIVGIGFVLRLSAHHRHARRPISPDGFYYSLAANLFAEGEGWPNPLALAFGDGDSRREPSAGVERAPHRRIDPGFRLPVRPPGHRGARRDLDRRRRRVRRPRIGGASVGLVAAAITAVCIRTCGSTSANSTPSRWSFLLAALTIWQAYAFLDRPTTLKATALGAGARCWRIDASGADAAVRIALLPIDLHRARQSGAAIGSGGSPSEASPSRCSSRRGSSTTTCASTSR